MGKMSKSSSKGQPAPKIVYPAGCKDIDEELGKDELVKRLKMLARAFQEMGQDDNEKYTGLSVYLSSNYFLDHSSKDVKLLVACCIADVFRVFAPEAPYTDGDRLKEIFLFLTKQLRGLEDPDSASFKRYFYLLENLAWVKSFNICIELDCNQEIFCNLYKLIFSIVNEKHSQKVKNFMLDMMCPLITEADAVSQELLDIILTNIIEPYKSQNFHAYHLAKDLIKRTSNAIEPYIQTFFNNSLMLGKTSESELSDHIFKLIYELNSISPSILLAVLPQLEFKLKSNDDKERRAVTRLLAKMFSDEDSELATQNKPLWNCFLGRFNDINVDVRTKCVNYAQHFLVNHPRLVKDITEMLKTRCHDSEESVRLEVVGAIINAAKKDLKCMTDDLFTIVKERTLDKKFKIRREALLGLAHIYKKYQSTPDVENTLLESIAWIRNKVLHAFYQPHIEDKLQVERLFNTCLVPYSLDPEARMKKLFHLYANIDDHATRALNEMLKCQASMRNHLRFMIDAVQRDQNEELHSQVIQRVMSLSRNLPEPPKANDCLKKFYRILLDDQRIREHLAKLTSPDCPCKKAEEHVKEILKKMGNPAMTNHMYATTKALLERVAPVQIDVLAIKALMKYIDDAVRGLGEICDEIKNAQEIGMKVLVLLAHVYPGAFDDEEVFVSLIPFLKHDDDNVVDMAIQVFTLTGKKIQEKYPVIYSSLVPVLQSTARIGTPKQAKHAIKCIDNLCTNKAAIFLQIFEFIKKNLTEESSNFMTALVSTGHISMLCPQEFHVQMKSIISKNVVKDLVMQDNDPASSRKTNESWYADHMVSQETQAKVEGMKLMVRWLAGMKSNGNNSGSSTLRLLHTLIAHDGDLMEKGNINKPEMARLRLCAACCMLKICQESCYADILTQEQFQALAFVLNDSCYQVRLNFALKLHKGLLSLKLPLQFLSILALAANDPLKERKVQVKQFLLANIKKRRELLKCSDLNAKMFSLLPDYILPYAIHLLAHDPDLKRHDALEPLKNIKECLWFVMEPLTKSDSYNFSFLRRMILNIKQTKDVMGPNNEEMNRKLYATCDLALGLLLSKTTNIVLKDFPAEPYLPAKLFTQADQKYSNTRNYLPKELQTIPEKKKKGAAALLNSPIKKSDAKPDEKSEDGSEPPEKKSKSDPAAVNDADKKPARKSVSFVEEPEEAAAEEKKSVTSSSSSSSSESSSSSSDSSSDDEDEEDSAPKTRVKRRAGKEAKNDSKKGAKKGKGESKKESDKSTKGRGRKKEEKPASGTRQRQASGAAAAAAAAKGSRKITEFLSKKGKDTTTRKATRSPTRSNSSSSSSPSSSTSSKSPSKPSPPKRNLPNRTGASPMKKNLSNSVRGAKDTARGAKTANGREKLKKDTERATRKRPAGDSVEASPAKKAKNGPTKTKQGAKNSSPDSEARSSPRKKKTDSPAKRTRSGGSSQDSSSVIPSPSPKVSPKKKLSTDQQKKAYPMRRNVRRAGPIANGTSDGETPDSSPSTPKKRAAALAKAIETVGLSKDEVEQLNVKRKTRKNAKR